MDSIIEELKAAESASQARTDVSPLQNINRVIDMSHTVWLMSYQTDFIFQKIKDLESQLATAKADAESKIDNLNALVGALPSGK